MDVAGQTLSARTDGFTTEPSQHFKTVIVHQDATTGARAKAAIDRLVPQFTSPASVCCTMWDFEVLTRAPQCMAASLEAAQADLVIVSGHSSARLPNAVTSWIGTWLPTRRLPSGALAITFDDCVECEQGRRREPSPLCTALRRAAATGRMEFVCSRPEWQKTAEELFLQEMTVRAHQKSSVLEGILNRPGVSHWGLNE